MKRFSFVPGVLVVLAVCQLVGWAAEKPAPSPTKIQPAGSALDYEIRARHGLDYPPEVEVVRPESWQDFYRIKFKSGEVREVRLLGVKKTGLHVIEGGEVKILNGDLLSDGARQFFAHSGLGAPAAAEVEPRTESRRDWHRVVETADSGARWTPMGGWKGIVYLADGTALSAVVDAASATHLKFTVAGALRVVPLADVHPVTRGELGLGNDADVAAYEADLKRREREAVARAEAARQDVLLQAEMRARREERMAQAAAEERAKRAEAWARWQREQQTEELRRIADELELRRLQGR